MSHLLYLRHRRLGLKAEREREIATRVTERTLQATSYSPVCPGFKYRARRAPIALLGNGGIVRLLRVTPS